MVRLPCVEGIMQQALIVEVAIASVDRQLGRGNGHQDPARRSLHDGMIGAGSDDDHFMAKARRSAKLRLHISADTAATGGIESADVNDTHRRNGSVLSP